MKRLQNYKKSLFYFSLLFLLLSFSTCTFITRTPFKPVKNKIPNLYRGVYHVHSEFSHDSKASLQYIIDIAKKAGLDFVVVTDHNNMNAKKALRVSLGKDEPLLIVGTEISTWRDGHLGVIGIHESPPDIESTKEIVDLVHRQGGYAIPAHPFSLKKPWTNWGIRNYDGMEVFCFSDFFYEKKWYELLFKSFYLPSEEFLKSVVTVNPKNLKRWDQELSTGKRMSGFGAVDAHIKFRIGNFVAENLLMSFESVTMYVFAKERTEADILEALAHGKSFIAFEIWGPANEFSFSASDGNISHSAGDTVSSESPIQIMVNSPQSAKIKLIHNGIVIAENDGTVLTKNVTEAGYYRAEVYLEGKLWIISNPIYVR